MAVNRTRAAFGAFMGDGVLSFLESSIRGGSPEDTMSADPRRAELPCKGGQARQPPADGEFRSTLGLRPRQGKRATTGSLSSLFLPATLEKHGFPDFPCGEWPILGPLSHHQMRPRRVFGHPLINWRRPASCGHPTDNGCPTTAIRLLTTLVAIQAGSATVSRETPVAAT